MIDYLGKPSSTLVTVFGGSGFLGQHVVRAIARRGYRIRLAVRRPDLAMSVQPLGILGQIAAVQANVRYPASVARAVEHADAVVNLVGILQEGGRQSFAAVQADGAGEVAQAAKEAGARLIHVSAIGADPDSPSEYARSKAVGERHVLSARPDAIVVRPSVLFGPGDTFFNRFASLARALPVLPLAGAGARFQPVYVGDVAEAIALAVDGTVPGGRVYELGGPEIRTLHQLVEYVLATIGRKRVIVPVPPRAARIQATVLEFLDTVTLGLMPNELKLTRDQVLLLQRDTIVSEAARAERRTLEGIGIAPMAFEAVVPSYLVRFRRTGQFDPHRDLGHAGVPDTIAPVPMGSASQHNPGLASGPAAVGDRAQP